MRTRPGLFHRLPHALLLVCWLASATAWGGDSCALLLTQAHGSTALNRIERNPSMKGVSGSFLVDVSRSGLGDLSAPAATALAADIASLFPRGALADSSVTEIFVIGAMEDVTALQAAISGKAFRHAGGNFVVDFDTTADLRRVYVLSSALNPEMGLKPETVEAGLFVPPGAEERAIDIPKLKRRKINALMNGPAKGGSVFVGGLISISAEPPEGFFAASTAAEFAAKGWMIGKAEHSSTWIYRVPDSREESYFKFAYSSPDRARESPHGAKFKIAAGIGPANLPRSKGGAEADLLWLGDEQGGALERYLRKISGKDLELEDLYVEKGLIQKINPRAFVVAGADHTHALTEKGFSEMVTEPAIYRRVFSEEYDKYLLSLFETGRNADAGKSYLLATSRGCSQGCAICCSGGTTRFQFFPAERMLQELEKIAKHGKMKSGETFNVFFVDSNFNNNSARLIEFADLHEKSQLNGRFHFFVRHNTANGFLKAATGGVKVPNEDLIDAYFRLGIREIFMGIDAFDDASIVTLKTHKFKVAKEASDARPIYNYQGLKSLIAAFEKRGLFTKGFFLTNNPWVSDFDRIDSYYNLVELWLVNPHFSIDSRERAILRLKPFEGSPIGEVSKQSGGGLTKEGRFVARGPLGEFDEMMEFSKLGAPQVLGGAGGAIEEFRAGIAKLRDAAERVLVSGSASDRMHAERIIRKIIQRERELAKTLVKIGLDRTSEGGKLIAEIQKFTGAHADLPDFDPEIQKEAFRESSKTLVEGLRTQRD
ncbi:MAG: hypothetical protein HYW49_12855 [Deltaproteobacteria bacterium]|nr:hypothetical protein [Deltaproteobacteria bacterium]